MSRTQNRNVCRRLFDVDDTDTDNHLNILQEELENQTKEKSEKWGFDFKTETPLDGNYDWVVHGGGGNWIGKPKPKLNKDPEQTMTDDFLQVKNKNELTPINNREEGHPPAVRKRSLEEVKTEESGVKKRLRF